ncbi:hypothetical protein ANOM_007654 [Aspergillus nomiae NRRL 13137]|uniref:Uncharacterized protein n=1 Tax=Aspergillus nomiae NRRL (strain ATCC 15546 / NRRL 13137 / CBS 260.88 / M93) TaxID=1509407 RepID=A0A0L1J0C4_ASPN3|nr:uncharacterized protein ANOM_007654 [Aspergillus nomiae NRRL 13137]KNG84858.1 hypothetical protein ANOM_007654 [Aspergillus nomiae NRRL 13137]
MHGHFRPLESAYNILAVVSSLQYEASEIVGAVLSLTVPVQTRLYMRQVLDLYTGIYPYSSFEQAQTDILLLTKKITSTPEQLRKFVALSHRIHVLAHLCIERCLQRCLRSPLGQRQYPEWFYFPTWTEEQRMILSFWRLLFYNKLRIEGRKGHLAWRSIDLAQLLPHRSYQHFTTDTAQFQAMTVWRFICEQINPEASEEEFWKGSEPLRLFELPKPPEGTEFGWTCQPPPSLWAVTQGWNPDDPRLPEPRSFVTHRPRLRVLGSYSDSEDEDLYLSNASEGEESQSDESESDEDESDGGDSDGSEGWVGVDRVFRVPEDRLIIVENPPRDPEILSPVPLPIQGFGEFPSRPEWRTLHGETLGVQFWRRMDHTSNGGPGQYIRPTAYLKYGFAIWEEQRMIDMGLWSTEARVDASDHLRRWYSFLSEEDLKFYDCRRRYYEFSANRCDILTKVNVEIISPRGSLAPLLFNDATRNGFTSEIAAWLALSTGGEVIGSSSNDSGTVFLDPLIWGGPIGGTNVSCHPPCTVSGYHFLCVPGEDYYNDLVVHNEHHHDNEDPRSSGTTISLWNFPIGPSVTSSVITPSPSVIQTAFNITWPSFTQNTTTFPTTVVPFYPPPWPGSSVNPSLTSTRSSPSTSDGGEATKTTTGGSHATSGSGGDDDDDGGHKDHHHRHPITHHIGPAKPKCTSNPKLCGVSSPNNFPNDPNSPDPGTPDDPNNPSGPSSTSSECSTATYSSCNTACVTAASTSSCTSTCKDIVGCDTTGTSTLGTYTLAPIMTGVPEPWYDYADNEPTDAAGDWAAGASIYRSLGETADPTSGVSKTTMTTTQQPTTTKAPPTPSPTSVFAVFAQEIQAVAHGGGGSQIAWAWQGMLLPYPKWYGEACNFKEYRVVDGGFFSKGQKYPSSLGTFSLGSYKNCKYTGSKDSVGEVNCDGGLMLSCTGIDKSHATPNSPFVDCEKVDDPEVGIAKNQLYLQLYCPVV